MNGESAIEQRGQAFGPCGTFYARGFAVSNNTPEITPAMIEAGIDAFYLFDLDDVPPTEVVISVFSAMALASVQPLCEDHEVQK